MIRSVRVAPHVHEKAHERYGDERSGSGAPSEFDFVGGPLAAAAFAFKGFDEMSHDLLPTIATYIVPDPIFGAVTFAAVLLTDGVVEIVDFDDDPDYFDVAADDPE